MEIAFKICPHCEEGYTTSFLFCPNGCEAVSIPTLDERVKNFSAVVRASGYSMSDYTGMLSPETAPVSDSDSTLATFTPARLTDSKGKKRRGKNNWSYLGLLFDSKDEALRYGYLKDKQDAGIIRHLFIQPTMIIRPQFKLDNPFYIQTQAGKPRGIGDETYTADYAYIHNGLLVIEDVKGVSKGKPYSKSSSTRSQKHLLYRYKDKHHVVFMLTTLQRGHWRYWQASTGYPELSFTLANYSEDKPTTLS